MSRTGRDLTVLSNHALNRATLSRQWLLARERVSAETVLHRLTGMQGQVGNAPYIGLWNRIADFDKDELSALLLSRKAVRATMMRGTVHVVLAEDYRRFRPLLQPVLERALAGAFGARLAGCDIDAILAAAAEILGEGVQQGSELAKRLQARWPERDADALGMAARYLMELVHVPPAGLWDKGGAPKLTPADLWLEDTPRASPDLDMLVLRYLEGFGPASVADAQAWSGLTRLGEVFERLRPQLASLRNDEGRELFDLPERQTADEDGPAPTRFLGDYDNVFLGYADRRRLLAPEHWDRVKLRNGMKPLLLHQGFGCAGWSWRKHGADRVVVIEPFGPLGQAARAAIEEEAQKLLAFATPEGGQGAVEFLEG